MSWRRPTELCCPIFLEKLKNHTKIVPDKKDSSFFSYFQIEMISNLFHLLSLSHSLTLCDSVRTKWLALLLLFGGRENEKGSNITSKG
jgi:hypothetical protein